MNTKTMKILTLLLTILLVIAMGSSIVYGLTPGDIKGQDIGTTNDITTIGKRIVGAINVVGIVLSVVIVAVLGIKYMVGSAEEKADYKKSMMPYLIGAACLFLAPTIANGIYNLLTT